METYEFRSLDVSGRLRNVPTVVAIGVFDGVHNGHQRIFETLVSEARKEGNAASLAISFLTNPKSSAIGSLDTIRLREEYIASFGVDFLALIDFSTDFSKISASGFVDMLLHAMDPIAAVVGEDFRFGAGAEGIAKGGLFGIEKYANCLYPLFFLGHFKYEKHGAAKVMLAYAAGTAVVLLFLAVFYGIFSDIALRQINTIAQISKYTTAFTSLGRIDLLFVYALSLVLSFAACLPMQLSVHCAKSAIGCKPLVPALLLNGALLAGSFFFSGAYRELQQIVIERLWFLPLLFAYLLPALAALFAFAKGRKKNA